MNGVISRLTNRIFGLAPVARVRLPTRFEPSGAAFAGGGEPAEIAAELPAGRQLQPGVEQVVVEHWTLPAPPLLRPEAGKPQRAAAPRPERPAVATPMRAPRQAPDSAAPPIVPQVGAARAYKGEHSRRAREPLGGPQSVTPDPPHPPAAPVSAVIASVATQRPTPASTPAPPELKRPRRDESIAPPATPAMARARSPIPVSPVLVAPKQAAAAPAAEPLEIIIERIDVRAPAPRAPAVPSVSAGLQRIPSLAAYLQTKR